MKTDVNELTLILATLSGGGIQRATIRLIKEFEKQKIQTTLVVVNGEGQLKNDLPTACKYVDLNCKKTLYASFRLAKHLFKEKPEVVISSQTHLNVLLIIIRMLIRFPRILIVREHITFNKEIAVGKGILERFRPLMIRLFYPFASKVVAVSKGSAGSIYQLAKYKKEIRVIFNGIEQNEIKLKAKQSYESPWIEDSKLKVIVGMGRLIYQKNFSLLLRAFSLIEDKNLRLIIFGEGPELRNLKALCNELDIQSRVHLHGYIDNPFPAMNEANLFVLPSRWEGFANVVIEALSCGLPIVATDCPGGPSEILRNKPFGTIVPVEDASAMANSIQALIGKDYDRGEIIKYSEKFDIEKVAKQYIELIKNYNDD